MGFDLLLLPGHPSKQVFLNLSKISTLFLSISKYDNVIYWFLCACLLLEIQADMDELEEEKITDFAKLKRKVEAFGVKFDSCTPGQYDLLYCPKVFYVMSS